MNVPPPGAGVTKGSYRRESFQSRREKRNTLPPTPKKIGEFVPSREKPNAASPCSLSPTRPTSPAKPKVAPSGPTSPEHASFWRPPEVVARKAPSPPVL